jgi:hypothetical protein
MKIIVTKVEDTMVKGKYPAVKITGTKMKDGSAVTKIIFKNQDDLIGKIEAFVKEGASIEVVQEFDGKYWNVTDFEQLSNSAEGNSSSGNGSGGDRMSKEDWAKKDKITRTSIHSQKALAEAVNATKEGAKAEDILALATKFRDWLDASVDVLESTNPFEDDPRAWAASMEDGATDDDEGDQPATPAPPE